VQLALLTATVKLFIRRPTAGAELLPKVLKLATEEAENPDLRDRVSGCLALERGPPETKSLMLMTCAGFHVLAFAVE
jgi:hypothetical protein